MKIALRYKGLPTSDGLTEFTTRRIHRHLSRFGQRIQAVEGRLSDVNGPRGGVDKRCMFTATGPGIGSVRVEEVHQDFYGAVEQALGRLEHTVGRSVKRFRERRGLVAQRRVS